MESITVPIYRKGDKTDCSNYRGISLLSTTYKILSNILLSRLTPHAEEIIGYHQCGFRRNRSTSVHKFCFCQIFEKKWDDAQKRHTLKKNTKPLVDASKEAGLEANADKTKYMVMSRDQNAGRCHNIKSDNRSYEWLEEFKYLGTAIMNKNSIQEEIKSRLKSGSACFHSVQKLLSSSLLYKNIKIKIYRTIILPVVLYGCDT